MSDPSDEWHYAGISVVKEYDKGNGRISRVLRIPDNIIGEGDRNPVEILEPGLPIYWSYEENMHTVVISDNGLSQYKYVDTSDFSASNNYRTSVPKPFFNDFEPSDKHRLRSPVPEEVQFEADEERHFIYSTSMAERETKSCYVLTWNQFNKRFSDSDPWDGELSDVPRFIPNV